MAERMIKRRTNRLIRSASAESSEGPSEPNNMGKSIKRKPKKPKERWLLTRKTWRYMTDAGRKLIPDGAQNRPEDIPKIEAYFQEVCRKEAKFLLWRKNSYPGALSFKKKRRERLKGGSCRKATSADEVDVVKPERPTDLAIMSTSGGRFDIHKMKYDFLNKPSPSSPRTFLKNKETFPPTPEKDYDEERLEEQKQLAKMLEQYLNLNVPPSTVSTAKSEPRTDLNYQELVDKLQRHLTLSSRDIRAPSPNSSTTNLSGSTERVRFDGDHVQKSLSETLSRYYGQYSNRDKLISDLLTNRKALEKLYFDLRKTKGFRSRVKDAAYSGQNQAWSPSLLKGYSNVDGEGMSPKSSAPPPLIEIQKPTVEITYQNFGTQTLPITENELSKAEEEYKKIMAEREEEIRDSKHSFRRRSSVDNDDISQSVSDTIKRYLRMARKKSVDSDKVDRFKRVNYDRNLRNIKAKGEITKPGDDDGLNKGCQTVEEWIVNYRDLKFDDYPVSECESRGSSCRSSIDIGVIVDEKASPTSGLISSGQSFFSNLLHGNKHGHDKSVSAASATSAMMQKSKSSSSVHHGKQRLATKIFKSRSKSQTRPNVTTSTWTPQGSCIWNSLSGKQVLLNESNLIHLTEVERKVLQKVALAKLQALNLGVSVKLPSDNVTTVTAKPKRPLLKRARTTGIFDTSRKESDKEKDGNAGLVFGIPLSQCIKNDRQSRFQNRGGEYSGSDEPKLGRHGSRASFSSLIDATRTDERGSFENLMSRERIVGSVPGLLDKLSCSSATDIAAAGSEEEPAVPNILNTCIKHLEAHGLSTLGIFRVSTSKKRIRQLREDFDTGKETTLDKDQCPHDVATLIKEYLRELPDPLLCRDLYHAFVHTQKIRNRRLQFEALQHLIQLLPPSNRDTLFALLNFLSTVAKHASDYKNALGEEVSGNKMDANNLATVFAPNILHCIKPGAKEGTGDRPEDRMDVINVIRTLIDYNKELFNVPAELLDEVYVHMMDSHPEALDQLLVKKEASGGAEESLDDLDSESISASWTIGALNSDHSDHTIQNQHDDYQEPRKMYSREEFLHESAATGGPNMGMRIRQRDKYRERSSKKKRDESAVRRRREDEAKIKGRSSSLESSQGDGHEVTRVLRLDDNQNIDRRKSSPYSLDSSGVITASLTIPVQTGNQSLSLSVDDDIPYIEDGTQIYSDGRQQIPQGILRSPQPPPRRRQRSISGSDSSIASNIQPITGSISLGQQGYDSAVGSSATTFSSPPHNTTPSSTSSIADPGALSSPPSWASSPPTSPDSQCTSVNYIPDDIPGKTVRIIPIQKTGVTLKEAPVLQKVTLTSTSELQQVQKAKNIDIKPQKGGDIPKSVSSPAFTSEKQPEKDARKFSPSITSIGNAVLRSKTADFERIAKSDVKTTTVTTQKITEKKRYTKRRYTDSRHQTRHIPDAEALDAAAASHSGGGSAEKTQTGIYKRRELISSVPSK
ncbi:uncharacterized protein [Onthophagus taurus]|uniref:uncharacterized protein n=1 Tax=Onthophagus taurus TaxID=166361 RepID=UPI0039BEBFD4